MNIVVMMAGNSDGFYKDGYEYPKLLTEVNGKTMVEQVIEGLGSIASIENNVIFVINKQDDDRYYLGDVIKLILPHSHIMVVGQKTSGAVATSLLTIGYIDEEAPLVLVNGDQVIDYDERLLIDYFANENADAGTVIFNSVHPRWSYVKTDLNGFVCEAAEKRPISKNATAGFYYYKKASDYISCAMRLILKDSHLNGLFYICPVFNEMILDQKNIVTYEIDASKYHSFMSPEKVKQFEMLSEKK
jgi:NDP-sugar pyrophosphorylase family protein